MKPAARIAAAIEILEAAEASDGPAERVVSDYVRGRRYIGSKDRRAVTGFVYGLMRHRARLDWWLEHLGHAPRDGRRRMLAYLMLAEGETAEGIAALFDGAGYGPEALEDPETELVAQLASATLDHAGQPDWVRAEMPEWLFAKLTDAFGGDAAAELEALMQEAPVDLRVNSLKTSRPEAQRLLTEQGIETDETPMSPLGLRVRGRRAVTASAAFRDGLIELQDEGSQLAALLVDARPGMTVLDLCAGAGGKTLALAAQMAPGDEPDAESDGKIQGTLLAADSERRRLSRMAPRLRRAGAADVEIASGHQAFGDLAKKGAGTFDRVLVDAPCSGSGAWRRQPDARWRLTPEEFAARQQAQRDLLLQAAELVRPGGRLIYVTCSLLPEENGAQVETFLSAHPGFRTLPIAQVWADCLPGPCPAGGSTLLLTPARQGTDGFFVAVLERAPGGEAAGEAEGAEHARSGA